MDIISAPSEQFSPPTEITLVMYALREDGSINDQDYLDPHCSSVGATTYVYGCTFYDGTYEEGPGNDGIEKAYPFGDTYTVTIGYESHSIAGEPGVEFGYLHNVISQEMTEGSPLAAYAAQAVAARTYAYTQTLGGQLALNNSSAYQVYIPYRYDGLGEGMGDAIKAQRRAIVGQAVTQPGPLYMTYLETSPPIKAHFGMDNCTNTEEGAYPYLVSVYDPISAKSTPCNNADYGTGYGGLGSMGAARWAYGNLSPYGISDDWSVQWHAAEQILTHYYTRIHLHNAAGERLTPEYRWVPLQVNWHTADNSIPIMEHGTGYPVTFQIQNTGVYTWIGTGQFALIYHGWDVAGVQQRDAQAETYALLDITEPVPPGAMVEDTITLNPVNPPEPGTAYQLRFEMGLWQAPPDDWIGFSEAEAGYTWPTYDVTVCVGGPCQEQVFLPLVNREVGTMR